MEKLIKNAKYLSEVFEFLPSDVILNKGITGCGGSYLELHSKRNSVILVPTVELVKNKTEEGIQPVHGKVTQQEIKEYLSSPGIKKLLGTYDSIERILSLINPKEYFLLIDEYHLLFNAYNYRNQAVLKILQHYSEFDHFCFMSATPLNDTCILKELEHLDQITLKWENATQVNVNIIDTYYTNRTLYKLLASDDTCEWHIFLNSVKTIKDFISKLETTDYRIICSDKAKKGYKGLNYASTKDPVKRYNFYTSCSFEGCDLYSKNGRSVIVCDTNIATTILDISTLIRQICGRLRDSIYKDQVTLILNTNNHRYANVSKWQFDKNLQEHVAEGKAYEELFNEVSEIKQSAMLKTYTPEAFGSIYCNKLDNKIFYDDNLRKMDEYNYHLISEIYNSSISVLMEYKKNNMQADIKTSNVPVGLDWITKMLEDREYSYKELEKIFSPAFKEHGLEWSIKQSIINYFPSFTKRRKAINGERDYYYRFKL